MKLSVKVAIAFGAVALLIGAYLIVSNLPEDSPDYVPVSVTDSRIVHLSSRETDLASMEFIRRDGTRMHFVRGEREETNRSGQTQTVEYWTLGYPVTDVEVRERAIRDIAYTMSNLYSELIVDENPEDLSIYGLDDPAARATVTTKDGTTVTLIVGDMTPSRTAYYARIADEPPVYTLRRYTTDRFFTEINDLRDTTITLPDIQDIRLFRLVSAGRTTEIVPRTDADVFVGALLSSLKMTKPYEIPRTIDTQRFSEMVEGMPGALSIREFVDDEPQELAEYGLDPPRYEWEQHDRETSVHLLFGDETDDDNVYARRAESSAVFTVPRRSLSFLTTRPFTLVNKFVLIPNIDTVDRFTIETAENRFFAEIKRENAETATYFLNGKEIEETPFKQFYQKTIGLLVDSENPDPRPLTDPEVTITYLFNETAVVEGASAAFQRHNVDFYAVYQDGVTEFLLSAYQINDMIGAARKLLE